MLRGLLIFGILGSLGAAEDHWVSLRSDGFELFTNAGGRAGRTELVRLEQFRFALGKILGKTDLAINPPAQVFLFRISKEAERYRSAGPIQMGHERVSLVMSVDTPLEDFQQRLAKLL